ncbi:hypothetical protein ACH4C2_23340 [Streptomyces sp. NPDC018057]|uniref:hypothetical protein n=1 Tax=unclassified Streptomyces TaxID=2593676 RepID=UPI00379949BA
MKEPYWQPHWWRLLFRAEGEPGWTVMGPGEFRQVPNQASRSATVGVWADALLEGSADELDDLRGELLVECYTEPAPADGTPPVYSRHARLPGHALPPFPPRRVV